jgi:hypothetical protein
VTEIKILKDELLQKTKKEISKILEQDNYESRDLK